MRLVEILLIFFLLRSQRYIWEEVEKTGVLLPRTNNMAGEGASTIKNMEGLNIDSTSGKVDGEDEVNPWNVSSTSAKGVDYDKLIGK